MHRAVWIRHHVAAFTTELVELPRIADEAEDRYRRRRCSETRVALEIAIGDVVAAEVAVENIDDVSDEIAAGTITHDRTCNRGTKARVVRMLEDVQQRIWLSRPHQLAFCW